MSDTTPQCSHVIETVWAVIPTLNPPSDFGPRCLSLSQQVAGVVISDDGSDTGGLERMRTLASSRVHIIESERNSGIAAALNKGVVFALGRGAGYVLTVDQDSTLADNYVERAMAVMHSNVEWGVRVAAIVAGDVTNDRSGERRVVVGPSTAVLEALQAGMLISAKSFSEVGLFREDLFIDCVDTEFAIRSASLGLVTLTAPSATIYHAAGAIMTIQLTIRREPFVFSFHSPIRRYYITRNRIYLFRTYGLRFRRWACRSIVTQSKIAALSILFGSSRLRQLLAIVFGIRDGMRGSLGPVGSCLERKLAEPR